MSRVCTALALATLIPITAHAEPINVNLYSSSSGVQEGPTGVTTGWFSLDLGELALDEGASATFYVSGLKHGSDYTVEFDLGGTASFDTLRLEVLDPLGDGDDELDDAEGRSAPNEYSISNNIDGVSFAQDSGLERSALFAGGSANVTADETTHRGDILLFSGLNGAEDARVTFGLRDRIGGRGFLLQITALGNGDMMHAPEPGSLLLLGSGLAGLAAARRRRRARRSA